MADDEQRWLADIERGLAKDDPRLARRLGQRKPLVIAIGAIIPILAWFAA